MRYYFFLTLLAFALFQGCAVISLNQHQGAKDRTDSLNAIIRQYKSELKNAQRDIQQLKSDSLFQTQKLSKSQRLIAELSSKVQKYADEAPSQVGLLLEDVENRELVLKKWNDLLDQQSESIKEISSQVQPLLDNESNAWIKMHILPDAIEIVFTDTALFKAETSDIQPQVKNVLKSIANVLRKQSASSSEVIAYVDGKSRSIDGQNQDSWTIAAIRAAKFVGFLVDKGNLPNNVIKSVSAGSTHPIASNEFPPGQRLNRRVIWRINVYADALKNLLKE